MKDNPRDLINQSARAFDAELHTRAYSTTHADDDQLDRLISFMPTVDKPVILDLATGAGYVAMTLARQNPKADVTGLDIAPQAIAKNIELARRQGLSNLRFQLFDGMNLPFDADRFSTVFCRYALHHFPRPHTMLSEIIRTLRTPSEAIIADAVKRDDDECDFINEFQALKRDGHVRMYTSAELVDMFTQHQMILVDSFESSLSFSRPCSDEYARLIDHAPAHILDAYCLSVSSGEMQMTLPIFNGVFVQGTP